MKMNVTLLSARKLTQLFVPSELYVKRKTPVERWLRCVSSSSKPSSPPSSLKLMLDVLHGTQKL